MIRAVTTLTLDEQAQATLEAALAPVASLTVIGAKAAADDAAEVLLAHELPEDRAAFPRLRWLQLTTAGIDHLQLGGAWDDVAVTSASGLYTPAMAEYVIGSFFFCAQKVPARLAQARARSFDNRWELSGSPLAGTTIVLLGYGSIGREIARLATALRMRVIAVKAHPDERSADGFAEAGTGDPDGSLPSKIVGVDRLADVAAEADWLVISLPLTARTRQLVDAGVLGALGASAWLVNVGRGAVVDETALAEALRAGSLAGAVLDVFSQEPLPPEHELWSCPNTIITPHISGGVERWDVLGQILAENLRRLDSGEPLLNRVEPARGY